MDQFINKLLQEQGVPDDLDPVTRQQLFDELAPRVSDYINRQLIINMDEASMPGLEALLGEEPADQQRIQEYIAAHVPDTNDVVTKALIEFRAIYLGEKA